MPSEATTPLQTFPLSAVRLAGGAFDEARRTAVGYVLSLDADRLLAPFLREAGLEPDAEPYGNWESDGLDGHIGGHYLSGCAKLAAVSAGEERERLVSRVEHVLDVLERCQRATGGFVGGIPGGVALGDELRAGRIDADLFSLNGRWVPVYNLHKTLAGLLDAHEHLGSDRALRTATALAGWWLASTAELSDEEFERILTAEFGGMMDAFARLARVTGRDEHERAARRFSHHAILDPLAAGRDELDGLHANTQIPKVVGYERLGALTGDEALLAASDTFWDTVTGRRTVSIGGNSVREHFHPADDFAPMIEDVQGPESCNTSNMLDLARLRLARTGDAAAVAFAERALVNHLLSTQRRGGGFVYFTPMRPAHYRVYSRAQEAMWCCVGTGLENHARYGELVYALAAGDADVAGTAREDAVRDELRVQMLIPSRLDWAERGVVVEVSSSLPAAADGRARIAVSVAGTTRFALRVRRPEWASSFEVSAPGAVAEVLPGGDVAIDAEWEGETAIDIRYEARLEADRLPDGSAWASFRHGPIVLAARTEDDGLSFLADGSRMAHVADGPLVPLADAPIVVGEPLGAARIVSVEPLRAEVDVVTADGGPGVLALEPFSGIHEARHTVYLPVADAADAVGARRAELAALDAALAEREAIVDGVRAGEQQPEVDHGFRGEATAAGGEGGAHWRTASGWFAYDLRVEGARVLRVRTRGDGDQELSLGGVVLGEPVRTWAEGDDALAEYAVPEAIAADADGRAELRVAARPAAAGGTSAPLLEVQLRR